MIADLPYATIIDDQRGGLRRWLLFVMLRAGQKRLRLEDANVEVMREDQARLDERLAGDFALARSCPARGIAAAWIATDDARDDRVLMYIHGGAFMFRYPRTHAMLVGPWCAALDARALMVDYRLAPECPFPAAADDCHAAYRWLLERGFEPRNIVIAGDSAGGNLALATLHSIKRAGEPMPACAVLLSPVVDMTMSGSTFVSHPRRDPVFSLPQLIGLRNRYLQPEQMLDPRASPLFASFRGFPPLLIQCGTEEVLLDDSLRGAARAHQDGVDVELEIWRSMPHAFQVLRALPQADAASERIVDFIGRHTRWRRAATDKSP